MSLKSRLAWFMLSVCGALWLWEILPGRLLSPDFIVMIPKGDESRIGTEITLTNCGFFPLRIKSIRSSCGCLQPELPNGIIQPWSSTKLRIFAERPELGSKVRAIISIETSSTKVIGVLVTATSGITAEPDELVIAGGSGVIRLFGVPAGLNGDLAVSCDYPFLNLQLFKNADGTSRIEGKLNPSSATGFFRVPIRVYDGERELWSGVARGKIPSIFSLDPNVIFLGEAGTKSVVITSILSDVKFQIVDVVGAHELGIDFEIVCRNGPTAMILFKSTQGRGISFGVVTVTLRDEDNAVHEVFLSLGTLPK